MKKTLPLLLILFVMFADNTFSQSYQRTSLGVKANIQSMDIEVQFYSPQIVRVLKQPEGSVVKKESLSVIKKPQIKQFDVTDKDGIVTLKSDSIVVTFNLKTGRVSFATINGTPLFTEKDYGAQFTQVKDGNEASFDVRQSFLLDKDEVIYGLGQQPNGKLNQRGQKVYLRNENTRVCIPFFQSVKGYGIYWDSYAPTTFTDNVQETSFDSEVGNCADYYFMYGAGADGVVAQMRDLTGQAPMMPLWVYGYSQSRERYKTQFELISVVKKYRELKVPLDGIVQDWQYWGKDDNWNAMAFDAVTYPKPQLMVDSVHLLNAHLFIVAWPGFAPKTPQFKEFQQKSMLINFDTWPPGANTRPYDVYNPVARDIYWSYLSKGLFSLGPDAWWLDSTEPDHINIKDKDFDQPTFLGTFRKVQNAFPLEHTKGVYEHQRQTSEGKRVILLTRSAFAGQQRYSANTWSGDVRSDWPTLKKQIPNALNFSMTGLPYWNADIGGFFAGNWNKGGGINNPEFQELYARWLQFATFTPMMRSHGTDIPREIYQFGKHGDRIFDVLEKFINLRYSLLPYTYSTAWDVTHNSGSIMRPLYAGFGRDKQGYENNTEYLFGKSFLVMPVTSEGVKSQNVYLPAGTKWYDFWTGEVAEGGKTIERATPIDILPLYVQAGSIIPWGPKVQYATEKKWDNLTIRIYPGADGKFTLYEDQNDNYNYEKGMYNTIDFMWNDKERTLTINKQQGAFPGEIKKRNFNLIIVRPGHGNGVEITPPDKTMSYNGRTLKIKF
ncbi:xylosidase [Mucilaginibacter sp. PPCGB 2223]|uniref:glycoside hydrolase family 31 protein n=1 Tax=Mucilaginibacter sp. PPCGB 2223 TaxID=1886027 RepID=UPI000825E586|nr:TIM-barrel domain-containing protein [Mucilaginibacter sp. PPCGB 2223]OCX53918.1 xylosidase [Mucilaginibacter sp. PPCGB 2223]